MYLNFPEFIDLAKGERKPSWHTRRQRPHRPLQIPDPEYDPDFVRWTGVELAGFSFVRAGREEPANAPTHIQTSPDHDPLFLKDVGALGEVPLLSDCIRLSLVISDANNDEDPDMETVDLIKNVLGEGLMHWSNLRHLYLGCTFPAWDDPPPMRDGKALDCKTYFEECESDYGLDWVEEIRQDAEDQGYDYRDDACAMELWVEQTSYSEALVRCFARACRTLELFEWSMPDFNADGLIRGLCTYPPLGRWKIYRDPDGSVRTISGQVTWNGHPNHPSVER
ncbi:hypothetical protein B0H17DRAFT_1037215 [Mycena rosella]|uniref:Uncharacterized protein n=1 Tax=Mycena rosella TaxID=1033263 RepID=A0AAD7GW14_MYCRO|nr:hypothetical protein B0H17DRAFT_1037215 [Mycena rosella]